MTRRVISFNEFRSNFIARPDGYFPVHASIGEREIIHDNTVEIDLICECRLTDGKVLFLAVLFDGQEEFDAIRAYLHTAAALLYRAICKNFERLLQRKDKAEESR